MTDRQQAALFSTGRYELETPQEFFDRWDREFHFTLDAAASRDNAKCERFFTEEEDGLAQSWAGNRVWCNPPYGKQISAWVRKGWEEAQKPDTTVVMLLPARTDTAWFHDYVKRGTVFFIRKRLKFSGSAKDAPFSNLIVVFDWRCRGSG